jgi:hypothetical protein
MRKLLITTTALFALMSGAAYAELTTEQIVDMFPGAAKIEIERGATTTKVEAIIGNQKIEVVFDNATDAELSRETKTLTDDDLAGEVGDHSIDDDNGDDDSSDDDDDSDDDDSSDDDSGDDDSGDDGDDD